MFGREACKPKATVDVHSLGAGLLQHKAANSSMCPDLMLAPGHQDCRGKSMHSLHQLQEVIARNWLVSSASNMLVRPKKQPLTCSVPLCTPLWCAATWAWSRGHQSKALVCRRIPCAFAPNLGLGSRLPVWCNRSADHLPFGLSPHQVRVPCLSALSMIKCHSLGG